MSLDALNKLKKIASEIKLKQKNELVESLIKLQDEYQQVFLLLEDFEEFNKLGVRYKNNLFKRKLPIYGTNCNTVWIAPETYLKVNKIAGNSLLFQYEILSANNDILNANIGFDRPKNYTEDMDKFSTSSVFKVEIWQSYKFQDAKDQIFKILALTTNINDLLEKEK